MTVVNEQIGGKGSPGWPRGFGLASEPQLASLTRREHDVLDLLVEGRTSPQIVEAVYVAPSTVCFHVRHIYETLHVHTRGQAVACALVRRVM